MGTYNPLTMLRKNLYVSLRKCILFQGTAKIGIFFREVSTYFSMTWSMSHPSFLRTVQHDILKILSSSLSPNHIYSLSQRTKSSVHLWKLQCWKTFIWSKTEKISVFLNALQYWNVLEQISKLEWRDRYLPHWFSSLCHLIYSTEICTLCISVHASADPSV